MNDFRNAVGAVDHAVTACGSWHRTSPLAVPTDAGYAAPAAAIKPELLAMTAAIPAPPQPMVVRHRRPARSAVPVYSQRIGF